MRFPSHCLGEMTLTIDSAVTLEASAENPVTEAGAVCGPL